MDKMINEQGIKESNLFSRLCLSAVDYRHALALLDPSYIEWHPGGKPRHHLTYVDDVPLLIDETQNLGYCLSEVVEGNVQELAQFINKHCFNELHIFEEKSFHQLKPYIPDGQWRLSRNYQATALCFRPKPNVMVRKLCAKDRDLFQMGEKLKEENVTSTKLYPAILDYPSTMRDFHFMMNGLPVICYGMITDGRLVGFCSANPIYTGVMEISWLVVSEENRRRGIASGLLTAITQEIFSVGKVAAYYAGSAGEDLDVVLTRLGFQEVKSCYRYIPYSSNDQWRTTWGKPL